MNLLTADQLGEAMVTARLARQQILDTDRTFHLVLTESALRWHGGSPETMARQAEHLVTVTERPNVRLGISSPGPVR